MKEQPMWHVKEQIEYIHSLEHFSAVSVCVKCFVTSQIGGESTDNFSSYLVPEKYQWMEICTDVTTIWGTKTVQCISLGCKGTTINDLGMGQEEIEKKNFKYPSGKNKFSKGKNKFIFDFFLCPQINNGRPLRIGRFKIKLSIEAI